MRAAALAVLVAVLAAAGIANGTTRPPLHPSGLYGLVMRGPITPVCQVGQPCDAPAANVTFQLIRNHRSHRVTTDATGHYRVRLAAGRYVLARTTWGPGGIRPANATVPYGRFKRLDIFIDTGIR